MTKNPLPGPPVVTLPNNLFFGTVILLYVLLSSGSLLYPITNVARFEISPAPLISSVSTVEKLFFLLCATNKIKMLNCNAILASFLTNKLCFSYLSEPFSISKSIAVIRLSINITSTLYCIIVRWIVEHISSFSSRSTMRLSYRNAFPRYHESINF